MISIFKSHNLHHLAGHLTDHLEKFKPADPFKPQQIIVPNLDTSRWLKLELAEGMGIAANFEFILPAEWQYRQIRKLYPNLPRQLPSDPDSMRWSIFDVLMDDQLRKAFPKPNRYINSQSNEMKEQAAMQLARQISSVFDQYLMYRPEMILKWQEGETGHGDEKWQAELWNLLNRTWKKQHENDSKFNKAELHQHTVEAVENGSLTPEDPVYVFNPGLIPKPIVKLFKACGDHCDLTFYTIQPSENLSTNDRKNELLQSFGEEAGNVEELFQILDGKLTCDFRFEQKTDNSLHRVKKQIIENQPIDAASGKAKLDESIQVQSCHSPLREIETLHQFLLKQFEKNKDLHPDDILVVTPDLQVYEPAIDAVFGIPEEGIPTIPYHLGSMNAGSSHSVKRAFSHFLSLPDSRFTFAEVMDLFQMKPIREKLGLSESDCQKVKQWMEENHVMWAMDANHRKEWDQPAEEMQTWYSALKRTWLGQWMGDEDYTMAGGSPLYNGVGSTDDQEIWAAFTRFLNRLDAMRNSTKRNSDCSTWCERITKWIEMFFSVDDLQSREGLSILNIVDTLKETHKIANVSRKVPFGLIRQEIISSLDQQSSGSTLFTRGVTFSTMVPVRSLPFKMIALIGLNEDKFPRKPTSPDFDLMAQFPETSDRNRKKEDRNLFLESILSAEDIHYCSYVGKSPFDNEAIPPSTIVSEW
ncbi:MAG: exodeoxyribonuclease V subunit gamma, partial [Balneolaceae bacterium]